MANYIIFSSESSNGIILAKSETEVKTDIETKVEPDTKTKVIVSAIKRNPHVTISQLAKMMGMSTGGVEWHVKQLQKKKLIKHVGPNKGGHWEIIAKQEDGQDSD